MKLKDVKKLVSKKMTDRKNGVSVVCGNNDDDIDRIEIKFPKGNVHISFNGIKEILQKHGFYLAQIIDFYYPNKMVALLIRDRR